MGTIPAFSTGNIVFLLIDLQKKLLDRIPRGAEAVAGSVLLLEAGRILGIPAIVTTQYRKGLGDLAAEIESRAGARILDKMSFSCGADPAIRAEIDRHGREWVAVAGVETHICVLQTALDLLRGGKRVAVVADAVAARGERDHELALRRMEVAGAALVTKEMLVYELLGRADSAAFKQILPLIKS